MRNKIVSIICAFRGHIGLTRGTEFTRHYIKVFAGRGVFCRNPEHYIYGGRLYKCSRCGQLCLSRGILMWELDDLVAVTLKDLSDGTWIPINLDYDFTRIWK